MKERNKVPALRKKCDSKFQPEGFVSDGSPKQQHKSRVFEKLWLRSLSVFFKARPRTIYPTTLAVGEVLVRNGTVPRSAVDLMGDLSGERTVGELRRRISAIRASPGSSPDGDGVPTFLTVMSGVVML